MNEEEKRPAPGTGVFLGFMAIIGVLFLLLIPVQTSPGPPEQGWWTQPQLMPMLSLILVAVPAVYLIIRYIIDYRGDVELQQKQGALTAELLQWLKPTEYFIYYIAYIYLLGLVGYFLSSLIFILYLSYRVGLRESKWRWVGLLTAIGLIAVFRWVLQVWIPVPALFNILPPGLRIFLSSYF